jgi:hypothetical protein
MDLEANPEEIGALAEHQKAPNEEAAVEAIGALEDRYGDRRITWPEKRTQGNGGFCQKLAVDYGQLTCRSVPALSKEFVIGDLERHPATASKDKAGDILLV